MEETMTELMNKVTLERLAHELGMTDLAKVDQFREGWITWWRSQILAMDRNSADNPYPGGSKDFQAWDAGYFAGMNADMKMVAIKIYAPLANAINQSRTGSSATVLRFPTTGIGGGAGSLARDGETPGGSE
jgi:hypothetical protein